MIVLETYHMNIVWVNSDTGVGTEIGVEFNFISYDIPTRLQCALKPAGQRISCRIWSSQSDGYEEFCLLEYNAVVRWKSADVLEEHIASKTELCLPPAFTLVSCSAYRSA
jgi:hypothetical protein